jgi:K+-transporting ATPase KdpF subunit
VIAFLEWQDAVGLVLAVLAVIYLVFVLIFPERF